MGSNFCIFFFSSRRRHTRYWRDWSSDVCSSDLQMVKGKEFRSDLYYRLNVFPVVLPPLRERCQDIPPLAFHFVEKFSRRMGKQIDSIPDDTLAALKAYSWPGNVRELQNLIERAVIRADNGVLPNSLPISENNPIPMARTGTALHES